MLERISLERLLIIEFENACGDSAKTWGRHSTTKAVSDDTHNRNAIDVSQRCATEVDMTTYAPLCI